MKEIISILAIFFVFFSCKTREKQVQKIEIEDKKESKSTAQIKDDTFEIVLAKELTEFDKSKLEISEEKSKNETKNIEVEREFYENGTLKKEIQKNFSQFYEQSKNEISEMREALKFEKENSDYWLNSSYHYQEIYIKENQKSKSYEMQLKAKDTFSWQLFFVGLFLGWLILPKLLNWFWYWIKRFQPYIYLLEFLKKKR